MSKDQWTEGTTGPEALAEIKAQGIDPAHEQALADTTPPPELELNLSLTTTEYDTLRDLLETEISFNYGLEDNPYVVTLVTIKDKMQQLICGECGQPPDPDDERPANGSKCLGCSY